MIDWDYFRNIDFSYTGISAFLGTVFGLFLLKIFMLLKLVVVPTEQR